MRRSSRIVSLAQAVTRETVGLFDIEPWRVVTIPNGVDRRRLDGSSDRSTARKRLDLAPDARVLLSLAALTWEKDPMAHIEVASRVLNRCSDGVHLFAGDGPMSTDVRRRIAELGLGDRIRLLGARDDIPDLMSASDVLLFASRPDGMEGMPTIMIEAGMSGLPVVGFDVAGSGEVVVDGQTGVLIPWGSVEELSDAALELLIDDEHRHSMGSAARRACIERFDVSQLAPRYLDLYEELSGRL
jgi:glycosyltransferase involved in cell wall biosynthesis